MPKFNYVAMDSRGKETKGTLEVTSQNEAISRLKEMGFFPTKVVEAEKVKEKKGAFGFNARTDQYEDMIAAGVIDPTKVTRFALQNAASVASLMLTTQCMIADKPEEKGAGGMPQMPPGGGYPGMM